MFLEIVSVLKLTVNNNLKYLNKWDFMKNRASVPFLLRNFHMPRARVNVQGVELLGVHFATLCQEFDFMK